MRHLIAPLLAACLVAACAGGKTATPAPTVSGLASRTTGPASTVTLHDAAGATVSQPAVGGQYSFDVTGLQPPYLLEAIFPDAAPLRSLTGGTGTCDVNELTEAVLGAVAGGQAVALVGADRATLEAAEAALPAALDALRRQLAAVPGGATCDPFTGSAHGGDGHGGLPPGATVAQGDEDDGEHGHEHRPVTVRDPEDGLSVALGGGGHALSLHTWLGRPAWVNDPKVAVDPEGRAVVVWSMPGAERWGVFAQRRVPHLGWLAPVQVSDGLADASGPAIALDASGAGWAAWIQWDGTWATVWAAHMDADGSWGAAQPLDDRPGFSGGPRLAVSASGEALVAWGRQVEGPRTDVWARRLRAGQGWGDIELLSDQVDWAFSPAPWLDDDGEATVAWTKMIGFRQTLWVTSAAAGAPFPAAVQLSTAGRDVYGQTAISGDRAGRVVVLWGQAQQVGGFVPTAARRAADGSWGAPEQVGDGAGDSYFPTVAMNGSGAAVAAWKQTDDTRYVVHAARLDAAAGWQPPAAIDEVAVDSDYPSAAIDAAGDAMVAWTQRDPDLLSVRVNRSFAGEGWLGSTLEEQATPQYAYWMAFFPLDLGMNAAGRAVVVWGEDSM